ncbi:hypothetical protein D1631_15825 [Chryseobacterium nematophagum]|uniref:Fibrobacter succinogenes major paralogous domain-containing protein n=1 Tax=Chryseobacterium nematophagum TaxID=2305228 RepID=A0A3M7TKV9_9FLAO|nr:FISUMP domain-containing protein [Chryseobacterium nematophagum]RNA63289.1 hypothetical protein D1631_15825 [Chryseobacterium nematophagum]
MKNKFITLKKILPLVFLLLVSSFYGQVRIANSTLNTVAPNSSAFIDASSNPEYNLSTNVGKGLLYPRTDLTTFTAFSGLPVGIPNSYPSYYDGLMLFNTATSGTAGVGATAGTLCRGFWYYDNPSTSVTGGTWRPLRPDLCSSTNPPVVTALNCSGATVTGTLTQGAAASGVSVQVPYTGGNGVAYPAGTAIPSTTVTGLTATLQAGTLANGNGTLTYTISGTPATSGTAHFAILFGGQTCDLQVTVAPASSPVVLNCSGAIHYPLANPNIPQSLNPPLFPGTYYTIIPFTGGTGTYESQTVSSSGQVLGLVATLRPGQMSDHQLIFDISGQTLNSGTATFVFPFQGQVCSFTRTVVGGTPVNPDEVVMCGSNKAWMTRNLGADMSLDPYSRSAGLHGAKYQYGQQVPMVTQAQDQSTPGPVTLVNYNPSLAYWGTPKAATDPCPAGYKVPSTTDYVTLRDSNEISYIGISSPANPSNFSAVVRFRCLATNTTLDFPVAGLRTDGGGEIADRGRVGYYWESSISNTSMFQDAVTIGTQQHPSAAKSVRCIRE